MKYEPVFCMWSWILNFSKKLLAIFHWFLEDGQHGPLPAFSWESETLPLIGLDWLDTKMNLHHHHHHYTNSMSAMCQLLHTLFGPNFKGRFLGSTTTTTDTLTTTTILYELLLTGFCQTVKACILDQRYKK